MATAVVVTNRTKATEATEPRPQPVASTADATPKVRTKLAGWLHLVRVSLSRVAVWFVLCLALFAVMLVPFAAFSASIVATGSMRPAIGPGDVVVTRQINDDTEILGRVVTAEDPARGGLLTHRIVRDNFDGTYATRGDNNAGADSTPMPRETIRGRGFILVPWIGLPVDCVADGQWMLLGLAAAGMGVLGYSAFDRYVVGEDGIGRPAPRRDRRRWTQSRERRTAAVRLTAAGLAVLLLA